MQDFVVCDLETTGTDPHKDKIIEIGIVEVSQGKIVNQFETLINPGIKIPVKIKHLTGLEDHMFSNSPVLNEVKDKLHNHLNHEHLAGHNIAFDASFLEHQLNMKHSNLLDTLELARIIYPDVSGHRLVDMCHYCGIKVNKNHRALSDAMATAELALKLIKKIYKMELGYIIQLDKFLNHAQSQWSIITSSIIKARTRTLTGESIELNYAISKRELPNNKNTGKKKQKSLKKEQIEKIFSTDGHLSKYLNKYEFRPQQAEMANYVTDALMENKCLLMEAGTGTGKSLAYLIPALMWAIANKKKVLISTHTINLQEQLWNKELPVLKNIVEEDFSAALMKGRSNYICLRRWESVLNKETNFFPEEATFFARILLWLKNTETGDKNELSLTKHEKEYWMQVCSDTELCVNHRCKWFGQNCFVHKTRRDAENSDIIITNHSMLFTDIRSENNILPSFGALIIDEAHHLEDTATSHLGRQVSNTLLRNWLNSIYKTSLLLSQIIPPQDNKKWNEHLSNLKQERYNTSETVKKFHNTISDLFENGNAFSNKITFRIKINSKLHNIIQIEGENLTTAFRSIKKSLLDIMELLETWSASDELWIEYSWNINELIKSVDILINDLQFITRADSENYVYWGEIDKSSYFFIMYAVPIHIGELLNKNLFKSENSVILTSATLTVNNSFQYFMERTGIKFLPGDKILTKIVSSPFEYEKQCLLCIDNNISAPGEVEENAYYNHLAKSIEEYITTINGKTLVLFTSYYALKEVYYRLESSMEEKEICLLGHNIDGARTRLIEQFQNNPRSVLLGTSSFWEGIDIPGPALSSVIIVRLPFWPPNMPVNEARLEDLHKQGKNGFNYLSLPQAVIRFKQGFGRLIRSTSDKGVVIIMDKRLVTKRYGSIFLNSLPLNRYTKGETTIIKSEVKDWLSEK